MINKGDETKIAPVPSARPATPREVKPVNQDNPASPTARPAAPHPRQAGAAPVLTPQHAVKDEGGTIRFDWYPDSVSQVVILNHGERRVEEISGVVITPGAGRGPASLTFRKVPKGIPLVDGKSLHSGSIDLVGTQNADITDVDQPMAMAPEEARNLEDGDCIAADFCGEMAGARGTVMIKVVAR